MADWREPHWSEGMLLLPQHLQNAHRYWDTMLGAAWSSGAPHSWGFDELVISDEQIRDGVIQVERCRLRTPDGTWVMVPDNAEIAARPFVEALEASPDGMMVHLAIPRLHEIRPNAAYDVQSNGRAMRYLIEPLERRDENTGDNVQQIEVHSLRGRLLLGDERETPGFECVPMARLFLSGEEGGAPRRDETFIPPLLRIGASADLMRAINAVMHDVGARNRDLASEANKREMRLGSGSPEHIERLLMLHVLNEASAWFRQLLALADLRPWFAYMGLCRLAGQLSVFNIDRSVMEYPIYDHWKLGENFLQVCEHIRVLLRALGVGRVKWRDFASREAGDGLQVDLEEDWLSDRCEMYIGVHCSSLNEVELDQLLVGRMNWKIASLDDVDRVFTAGLAGLQLQPVRTAKGILPTSAEIKYYKVTRDSSLWLKIVDTRILAIRYTAQGQEQLERSDIRFRVYVIMAEEGGS